MLKVDAETEERLRKVAEARGVGSETVLREAVEQYLEGEEVGRHPSGKVWPRRHAVGGIITPV